MRIPASYRPSFTSFLTLVLRVIFLVRCPDVLIEKCLGLMRVLLVYADPPAFIAIGVEDRNRVDWHQK